MPDGEAVTTEDSASRIGLRIRHSYLLNAEITLDGEVVFELEDGQARVYEDEGKRYLEVELRRQVGASIVRDLETLAAGKVPEGTDPAQIVPLIPRTAGVRDRHIPVSALRAPLRSEILQMNQTLSDRAWSLARALRWRLAVKGPHRTLASNQGARWSTEGSAWKPLPGDWSARVRLLSRPRVIGQPRLDVERLATAGPPEPIAHELLREATDNASSNPRSSLVLAVAAIETGIKAYVADVAPDARWLAFETPSPPIVRMISDYLPTLAAPRGRRIGKPSKGILGLVEGAVKARNAVAHQGHGAWSFDQLDGLLDVARDFLYALDYFRGHDWAIEHLNEQARADWGFRRRNRRRRVAPRWEHVDCW